MKKRIIATALVTLFVTVTGSRAESEFAKTFRAEYGELGSELASKPPAEVAEIADFVYQKDLATFTFKQGKMYLLRNLQGRPTTAIFLGQGHAEMTVPSHTEKKSLQFASGDTLLNEDFEVAFADFSDDFDLRLKEKFEFRDDVLGWGDFNRSQQGEFFFKPVVMHTYDNYFQLMRSLYERAEDGYFWIDFNRYVYSFDPNRPEEVILAYEHEGGDQEITEGAVMQRREKGVYDDYRMSDIAYPTTILSREGVLKMTGLDGQVIDEAMIDLEIQLNEDSLRFLSLFLNHNLHVDSVYYQDAPVDYVRRGDFTFMGVILPEYRFRGDTITLRLWYHGKDYHPALPFVENPAASPHALTFDIPSGYNYAMPDMEKIESPTSKRDRFISAPVTPYRLFQFQPYASGFDTVSVSSATGLTLDFLKSKHINKNRFDCFIPDDYYQTVVTDAFNYMSGHLGLPLETFAVSIYPGTGKSMPGLMEVSQTECLVDETGGLYMAAGASAARQWFGGLMQPKTDREYWLQDALPDYLSLMYVWSSVSPSVFFGELRRRRDHIYTVLGLDNDRPLASGRRVPLFDRTAKGAWMLHMIRFMMFDLDKLSDRPFWNYINELKTVCNYSCFTNEDFIRLTEKHYGQSLDWFFKHWLYDRNIPEFEVKYSIEKKADGYYIPVAVEIKKVEADFKAPVIIRIQNVNDGSIYMRQMVTGPVDSFELGPFEIEPKEMIFNEFHSVLSRDKVDKK